MIGKEKKMYNEGKECANVPLCTTVAIYCFDIQISYQIYVDRIMVSLRNMGAIQWLSIAMLKPSFDPITMSVVLET